jgi:hypothetical protein
MSTKLAIGVVNLGLIYPPVQDSIKASNSTSEVIQKRILIVITKKNNKKMMM